LEKRGGFALFLPVPDKTPFRYCVVNRFESEIRAGNYVIALFLYIVNNYFCDNLPHAFSGGIGDIFGESTGKITHISLRLARGSRLRRADGAHKRIHD
jgi:hypothetical protein